ncbi:MAG TPA: 3-hydroxyacyl-CoA dehydrogenase NAD-binding domain-containing protein, partial [Brevibacterium sp.]|nr:3-hydroxyacyl-CoA dehydrogenase NAD-binding domain-containing protein [Brevibacterium sp.]
MNIERAGVVGSGLMGSGIAEVLARAGLDVVVRDISEEAIASGRRSIEKSLEKGVKRGKLSAEDRDAALARLHFTVDMADFADRQ